MTYEDLAKLFVSPYFWVYSAVLVGFKELLVAIIRVVARKVSATARQRYDRQIQTDDNLVKSLAADPVWLILYSGHVTRDAVILGTTTVSMFGIIFLGMFTQSLTRIGPYVSVLLFATSFWMMNRVVKLTHTFKRSLSTLTKANGLRITTTPST